MCLNGEILFNVYILRKVFYFNSFKLKKSSGGRKNFERVYELEKVKKKIYTTKYKSHETK